MIIQTHIPAANGWSVVIPLWDGDRDIHKVAELRYEPVLAWLVDSEPMERGGYSSNAYPITADDTPCDDYILRRPDGTCFAPYTCEFKDEAAIIAHYEGRGLQ